MSYSDIENLIGKELPNGLKDYLNQQADEPLDQSYSFAVREPSPFGDGVIESIFLPTLEYLKGDEFFEIGMLCIGNNMFGSGIYLSFRDADFGAVYYWDHDYRCFWDDETFYSTFPNLAEPIKEYLALRKNGDLPEKEEEFASFYKVSESFNAFIEILVPQLDDDEMLSE